MGTITLRVKELAKRRGITNAFMLSRVTSLGYAICHRMWNEPTTLIALATVAKLCDGLRAEPADIFQYKPKRSGIGKGERPL